VDILVFGAGALGSLFGGLLSQHNDVTLVARASHVEAIRSGGLRIAGITEMTCRVSAFEEVPLDLAPDVVLVTTKAYDTQDAVGQLEPFHGSAVFVSFQNGMGNEEAIAARASRVLGGVTSHGATLPEPGVVNHAGVGDTVVGPFKGVTMEEAREIADILTKSGIQTRVSDDIRRDLWMKLIVNCGINPLTAVTGVPNGGLLQVRELRNAMERAVREAVAVARAEGVAIEQDEAMERTVEVARLTAENRSSMLSDVERGRRTEIDAITGHVVSLAEAHGLEVPASRTLLSLVKGIESGRAGLTGS
jgi:2-dehydropantoate 2-reductase